jgi:hypothetical protein
MELLAVEIFWFAKVVADEETGFVWMDPLPGPEG